MFTIMAALALAAQPAPQETLDQKCEALGVMAQAVMTSRQSEVPMSKVMASTGKYPQALRIALQDMIRQAYARPSMYTPEAKADEVMRFRNEWEAACYRDLAAK
jgi:hypothetical protein